MRTVWQSHSCLDGASRRCHAASLTSKLHRCERGNVSVLWQQNVFGNCRAVLHWSRTLVRSDQDVPRIQYPDVPSGHNFPERASSTAHCGSCAGPRSRPARAHGIREPTSDGAASGSGRPSGTGADAGQGGDTLSRQVVPDVRLAIWPDSLRMSRSA